MERPDERPDAKVQAVRRSPLPDLRPADAIPLAPRASDASDAVPPDAAADAPLPALAAVPCAEKLAVPAPDVLALIAEALPPLLRARAKAPCTPAAGQSAA